MTVLSASTTHTLYFAELTSRGPSETYLRAGMWGACSFGVDTGCVRLIDAHCHYVLMSSIQSSHGCTRSQGGYVLSANLDVSPSELGTPSSPGSAHFELLGSHATGPLLCLFMSLLLVTVACCTWTYDVFGTNRDRLRITRPVSSSSLHAK